MLSKAIVSLAHVAGKPRVHLVLPNRAGSKGRARTDDVGEAVDAGLVGLGRPTRCPAPSSLGPPCRCSATAAATVELLTSTACRSPAHKHIHRHISKHGAAHRCCLAWAGAGTVPLSTGMWHAARVKRMLP